jgi:serine/threonine protein kinase
MELVEGTDLRRVLRRTGPLPPELAIYVGHELATALAHAHAVHIDGVAQRVVHRDVTPSNVLLSVDGTVKLTDFGIAKATTRAQVTQHGIVKGKVPYMSPEQAVGQELDQRTDLFALGVVLYECIAGRRPYDGPSDLDTFRNVQCGVHEPLDRLAPGTPRGLVELVHSLIRPRREDRIPSAADVVELLAGFAITLGARRALVDRVARCRAQPPSPSKARRPVRVPVELDIDVEVVAPAPLLPAPTTRALRAPRRGPLLSLTEQMSPTAIASCLGEVAGTSPSASTEVIPSTRGGGASRRFTRLQLALLAIGWVAISSLLGGLAAHLLPGPAAEAARTAVAEDAP